MELVSFKPPGLISAAGIGLTTGVMGAGLTAASEIYQWRWTDANKLCLIQRVALWAGGITAFTAGMVNFEMYVCRAWTADGSGGAAADLSANSGKFRVGFNDPVLGAARIATTGALTAGTKTLDKQSMANVGGSTSAVAGTPLVPLSEFISDAADVPLILGPNEGFVIKATVPATGTWTAGISVRHFEVAPNSL